MEAKIYSQAGKETGKIDLPENIFAVRWNSDLVKQVVDSLLSAKRKSIAHVKTRAEVSGGGKKPWKQKGTGRARHGSSRSPIWVGGGITHGPRNDKNYDRKVNKKMRVKALYTILSKKFREGEVIFVDSLALKESKTKQAITVLKNLNNIMSKKRNAAVLALSGKNNETLRAFRNLSNVEVLETRNLNPLALLQYKYLVVENPEEALKSLPKIAVNTKSNAKS